MHFKKIIISLSTTAASLALAAPAAAPAPAPALAVRDSPYVYHATNPYDWYAPCSNDWAHYDLKYNAVSYCKGPDADGTVKCTFHFNEQGTITTYDGGTKYQFVNVQNQKQDYEIHPPYEYSYTYNMRVRATKQGSGLVQTGTELVTVSYDVEKGYKVNIKKPGFIECV